MAIARLSTAEQPPVMPADRATFQIGFKIENMAVAKVMSISVFIKSVGLLGQVA
jgi:hypothetical protein